MKKHEANPIIMGSRQGLVIDKGCVYEYVGIGWIKLREATDKDYKTIDKLED